MIVVIIIVIRITIVIITITIYVMSVNMITKRLGPRSQNHMNSY